MDPRASARAPASSFWDVPRRRALRGQPTSSEATAQPGTRRTHPDRHGPTEGRHAAIRRNNKNQRGYARVSLQTADFVAVPEDFPPDVIPF